MYIESVFFISFKDENDEEEEEESDQGMKFIIIFCFVS